MRNIDDYLPAEFAKYEDFYFAKEQDWYLFKSYRKYPVDVGVTDFLFQLVDRFPTNAIVIEPFTLDIESFDMSQYTQLNFDDWQDGQQVIKYMIL